jgi:hypothetical protein
MKLILEGTEEQMKNLKMLLESGDNDLPMIKDCYPSDNMFSIYDVKEMFKCTDEEAMKVLEGALNNEVTKEQIWFAIGFHGDYIGLERK